MNKTCYKKPLITCIVLGLAFILFTLAVKFINIAPIGPDGSNVGFSVLNQAVHSFTGTSDLWYKITKYSGFSLVLPIILFAVMGVLELIKTKSFKKVRPEFKLLALFYVAVALVYILFEKVFIINFRPVLMDGVLEASYPSSHTLFSIAVCGSALLVSRQLLPRKFLRVFNVLMVLIMVITVVGRLLSGVHWFTDIIGGVLVSSCLLSALQTVLNLTSKDKSDII